MQSALYILTVWWTGNKFTKLVNIRNTIFLNICDNRKLGLLNTFLKIHH